MTARHLAATLDHPREAELEPDIILPGQLSDGLLDGARLQPERRLQLAVLEDAVMTLHRCVGKPGTRNRRLVAEVDAWLASDSTDGPFAFENICDGLNFDPGWIRLGLGRRWRSRAERPRFRRNANGTRHRVLLYVAPVRRTA